MAADHTEEAQFSSDEDLDDETDGSESSTDVDAKLAEEEVFDVEFLKCYSALKNKDDKIYDKNVRFFDDKDDSSSEPSNLDITEKDSSVHALDAPLSKPKSTAPKMTLLDLQLNLAKGDPEELELDQPKIDLNQQVSKSYYEKELEEIKKSIERVGEGIGSDSDDDLLVVKGSGDTKQPSKKRNRIRSIIDKIENEDDEDLKHLKQVWTNPDSLTDEDKYLRDYILNKRYLQAGVDESDDDQNGFFSKNLEDMSDADEEVDDKCERKVPSAIHHSEERDFDKIARIPRNSTKTIRDMVEKQEKKEKRLKKAKKEKQKKVLSKSADFEDIVGDMPTRFHYRETEPNDYGLTAEELLMATDEELDQWVSLHECVAYKTKEEELAQKKRFEAKRNNIELKRKIFKSIYGGEATEQSGEQQDELGKSKKNRKRKRARNTDSENSAADVVEEPAKPCKSSSEISNRQSKKKKRKRGLNHKKFASSGVAPDRLLAYGLSKTRLKKGKLL